MHKCKYLLLIVSSLLFNISTVFADEINPDVIKIATPEFYNGAKKDGTGFYFDVMHAVYDPLHIKIEYEIVPFNRAAHMLELKQVDAMFGVYSASLVKKMTKADFLLTPRHAVAVENLSALFTKKANIDWQGQISLQNKKVAWIRGYSYQYFLNVPVQVQELSSYDQIFPLLDRKRIDFYVDGVADINYVIKDFKINQSKYRIEHIASHNLYVGFSNTPRSQKLIQLFDQQMDALSQTESFQSLYKKWKMDLPVKNED